MCERLVLGSERRGGHLRNHETRIYAALLDQEWRQSRQVRIHHQRDTALGQRADFRDRDGEIVRSKRNGFGVEVATGQNFISIGEDERIVGDGIRFGEQHAGCMPHLVETRTHHLRLATQTVRVLHARAILV